MPIFAIPFMKQDLEFRHSHVLSVVSGWITVEEVKGLFEEILEHESFKPGMGLLWDFRQMEGLAEFSAENLRDLLGYLREQISRRGEGPSAYVMGRDVDYGVARMFEQIADPQVSFPIQVFRDMDAARAWVENPIEAPGEGSDPGGSNES